MNSLIRILFHLIDNSRSVLILLSLSFLFTGCASSSKKSYCDLVIEDKPAKESKADPENKKKTK